MSIKIIFLDRDGIINKDVGYLHKIKDFEFVKGIFEICHYFQSLNYQIIVITNQSGIARGYYKKDDFYTINSWMIEQFKKQGIKILDVFYCPHGPESTCSCRKPQPGMFIQATNKYGVDLNNSWMIGDNETDILAANSAGIHNTILVQNDKQVSKSNSNSQFILCSIKQIKTIITC